MKKYAQIIIATLIATLSTPSTSGETIIRTSESFTFMARNLERFLEQQFRVRLDIIDLEIIDPVQIHKYNDAIGAIFYISDIKDYPLFVKNSEELTELGKGMLKHSAQLFQRRSYIIDIDLQLDFGINHDAQVDQEWQLLNERLATIHAALIEYRMNPKQIRSLKVTRTSNNTEKQKIKNGIILTVYSPPYRHLK